MGLQCLHDGLDAEDNEQDVECGHDSCVKKQKNKCLAVVEADAAVDPGTRLSVMGYQWWSILRTQRLQVLQWWVRSGLNVWQMRQYFLSCALMPKPYIDV